MTLHVVRVVLEGPSDKGVTSVRLAGSEHVSHYLDNEAASSGVCAALDATLVAVARCEIPVNSGLLVRVEIERNGEVVTPAVGAEKEAQAEDPRAAFQRFVAVAQAVAYADRDESSYEDIMDDFEEALDEVQAWFRESPR